MKNLVYLEYLIYLNIFEKFGIFKNNIKNGRTINDISFNKGTVFNTNKRKDYIYY